MSNLRIINQQELDLHAKRGNLWVVIHGYVFDVSKWMESHPGGFEILLDYASRKEDAGREFEDIKHSVEAREQALQYMVGKLADAHKPFPMETSGKLEAAPQQNNESGGSNMMMIGGAILAGAVVAYFVMKQKKTPQ